jgi:porin
LEAQLLVDLEKLAGWKNWSFYANAFGIYNDGRIRRDYVGGMNTIAAIEATPTVRLSELWLERWVGPVSIRFGQLAADAEFFYSDLSQIFLQSDWATITAVNLPSGGPAYPLSAVGARIKYEFPKMHHFYLRFSTAIRRDLVVAIPTPAIATASIFV